MPSSNRRAWIDSRGNIHWFTSGPRDEYEGRVPRSIPNSKGHRVRFSCSTRGGGGPPSRSRRRHRRARHSGNGDACLNLEGRYDVDGQYDYYDIGNAARERIVRNCEHGAVPQLCERCEQRGRQRSRSRNRPPSRRRWRSSCTDTTCSTCSTYRFRRWSPRSRSRSRSQRRRAGRRQARETSRCDYGRGRDSDRDVEVRCYGAVGPAYAVSYGYNYGSDYGNGYDWTRGAASSRRGKSKSVSRRRSSVMEQDAEEYIRVAKAVARAQRHAARQERWSWREYGR
ncbi:hypothetical protein EDD37DRAFT_495607 [Exophiala viscosa]|uniref:Uncharacterized protein n=1 Tax=Exophiala viscosa TaxID=2486360 RepID=A0AAN6E028_9EURO|nr:hypothetical protein EDD36DRAFT_194369 [Exophiala viscosa]KAI1621784.1 hypothetical protein EDD37DRAFT_495607 [Exophiala viscosa]